MSIDDAMAGQQRPRQASVAVWAVAGVVLVLVLAPITVFLVAWTEELLLSPLGLGGEPGTASWGLVLAMHPVAWGLSVAVSSGWLGRRLVPGVRFGPEGSAVLAVGLALAAATTFVHHEFIRERYGWYDPEYGGWTFFAAPAMVAVALATWAALSIPSAGRWPLSAALVAAVTSFGLALAPSVPGLADGLREPSLPLAGILVVDTAYALAAIGLVLSRPRRTTDSRASGAR